MITVLKYSMPVAPKLSAISLVVITAAMGKPLPIGLPVKIVFIPILNQRGTFDSW